VPNGFLDLMIDRHQRDGVIVDTNLMLLHLVGWYDVNKIRTFRATRKYDASIFDLLAAKSWPDSEPSTRRRT